MTTLSTEIMSLAVTRPESLLNFLRISKRSLRNSARVLFYLSFLSILGPLVLIAIGFAAPIYEYHRHWTYSEPLYFLSRQICVQVPSHCLWIFGSNMAICSRCLGIYSAFLLTGLWILLKKDLRFRMGRVGFLLLTPMFIDGYTQFLMLRQSNNLLRLVTGILAGTGGALIYFSIYLRGTGWFLRSFSSLTFRQPTVDTVSENSDHAQRTWISRSH